MGVGFRLLNGTLTGTDLANYYSLKMRLGNYQDTLTAPVITQFSRAPNYFQVSVQRQTNFSYRLWAASALDELAWAPVTNAIVATNSSLVTLTDTNATQSIMFYRVEANSQ